jgi:hypothetical protein
MADAAACMVKGEISIDREGRPWALQADHGDVRRARRLNPETGLPGDLMTKADLAPSSGGACAILYRAELALLSVALPHPSC